MRGENIVGLDFFLNRFRTDFGARGASESSGAGGGATSFFERSKNMSTVRGFEEGPYSSSIKSNKSFGSKEGGLCRRAGSGVGAVGMRVGCEEEEDGDFEACLSC